MRYDVKRCFGLTLTDNLLAFVNSSTSSLKSSPNNKVDSDVEGLHKATYCQFRSGLSKIPSFQIDFSVCSHQQDHYMD
jgi:hypothetical protein